MLNKSSLVTRQKQLAHFWWFKITHLQTRVDASYGGSKATKIPIPKIHINGKINFRMEKNIKNQCWMGPMWWLIN